jgi:hypothetical protein
MMKPWKSGCKNMKSVRMRYSVIGGLCPAAKLKILGLGLL